MRQYLIDGREVEVIQMLEDGKYLVDNVYEYDGYEETANEAYIVDKVFDKPPVEKLNKRVQELTETIQSLNKAKSKIESIIRQEEKDREVRLDKFKKYEQLQFLEDFLDGKITHYVKPSWSGVDIIQFEETRGRSNYDHDKSFRLLSLFGRSDRKIEWNLHEYTDGSGSKSKVIPCLSYEQALEVAQEELDKKASEDRKDYHYLVKSADKYGLKISDEIRQSNKQKRIDGIKDSISKKQNEIEKLRYEQRRIK